MVVAGEPVHGVDLMNHPLIGNSRRIRPKESELEILSCVEGIRWSIDQESFPIGVLFAQRWNYGRTTPSTRLIYVPRHLSHHDVAELTGLEIIVSLHVARGGAALRSDLHDSFRSA